MKIFFIFAVAIGCSILSSCTNQGIQSGEDLEEYPIDSFFLRQHGMFAKDIWFEFKKGRRIYPQTTDSMAFAESLDNHVILELLCNDTLFVVTDSPTLFGDTTSVSFPQRKDVENYFGPRYIYDYSDEIPMGALVSNEYDTLILGKELGEHTPYMLEHAIIADSSICIGGIKVGMAEANVYDRFHVSFPRPIALRVILFLYPRYMCRNSMWYIQYFNIPKALQRRKLSVLDQPWVPHHTRFDEVCIDFMDNKVSRIWISDIIYGNEDFQIPNYTSIWETGS